jgi:hypothetical protein
MTLKWDSHHPIGDVSVIELSLDLEERDDLVFAPIPQKSISYTSSYRNPGETDTVLSAELAEARLELPGIEVKPREMVAQPFHPGGEAVFYWNVISNIEGDFMGRIWVYVRNQANSGKEANRYPIAVQPVEFNWQSFFGLNGTMARYIGIFGLTAGILPIIAIWHNGRKVPGSQRD